jgi:hypothetical protein
MHFACSCVVDRLFLWCEDLCERESWDHLNVSEWVSSWGTRSFSVAVCMYICMYVYICVCAFFRLPLLSPPLYFSPSLAFFLIRSLPFYCVVVKTYLNLGLFWDGRLCLFGSLSDPWDCLCDLIIIFFFFLCECVLGLHSFDFDCSWRGKRK